MEHPLLRFRLAAVLLVIVVTIGVAGYVLINGWSLLDSFYMVIITISTVGYTEVHPQGQAGRLFTSGLIVVGVGTMLYARSEEHTSELQSQSNLVCRLLL